MPITPDLERKYVQEHNEKPIVYKLVLTGGPCSGKTTGQARLSTFFENLGWKVYRVPETATVLFSGGVRFPDLDEQEQYDFQENLVRTMLSIEHTFFTLAESCKQNCLVICDRGIMDASAYMSKDAWDKLLRSVGIHTVDVRDNRYNQVIHLVTAADGAEDYYNCEDNPTRTEGVELARVIDRATCQAWVGHPYIDIIDNSTAFEEKLTRMLSTVCRKIGIDAGDRLDSNSRKLKFLIGPLPISTEQYPPFQDFEVIHDYLVTANPRIQTRLRKRGQLGVWNYQFTTRRSDSRGQTVEVRRSIIHRDYITLLAQRDDKHYTIYKTRRCFMWDKMYFQMDIYKSPCHARCDGLVLLETYSTMTAEHVIKRLPPFLPLKREVTGDPAYSMYNLSLKEEWTPTTFMVNGRCIKEQDAGRRRSSAIAKQVESVAATVSEINKKNGAPNKETSPAPGGTSLKADDLSD